MRFSRVIAIGLAFCLSNAHAALPDRSVVANAIKLKVEKFTLPNGLTVLLHEDHSTPSVTYQQWFRVGSRNEKPGLTGLAHFFEHLMFKGTPKYPGDTFDRMIRANGGAANAYTTRDFTAYYINLPPSKLAMAIDIEADRMRNLSFDQKQIDSEREVVKEERRMRVDNEVSGVLDEKLWRTVYKVHPYHWPVIGSMVDLNRATIDDMKEFYRINYAPNNAIVVLVGDFDSAEAKKMITKAYANIASQPIPKLELTPEPSQTSERRAVIKRDVQNVSATMAFLTVASGTDEMYALDLAASILGGGDSSRLYRKMVYNQQSVSGVSVDSYTPADPGTFRVNLSLKPGQSPEAVFKTVANEIYKLRASPVSDAELEKAKIGVMKDYVGSLKTISGKARALGIHEIYGQDYQLMFRDLEKYLNVTKEQIVAVSNKYLKPNARTIVWVEPGTAAATPAESTAPEEVAPPKPVNPAKPLEPAKPVTTEATTGVK